LSSGQLAIYNSTNSSTSNESQNTNNIHNSSVSDVDEAESYVAYLSQNTKPQHKFKRYDNVVIATKIHGPHQWFVLEQSLCLLHYAYNHRVQYDIVVFTTIPVPEEDIQSLNQLVSPANVSIVVDNRGLQNEIAALSKEEYNSFLRRCNVSSPENLTWFSDCPDHIAYNWQAEFRGLRLWHHPSIAKYSTMIWMDADGFATKPWQYDPVSYFIENDGVIMFDHFPQAFSVRTIQPRLFKSFQAFVLTMSLETLFPNSITTNPVYESTFRTSTGSFT
jgi:hypothetical protein